MANSIDFLTRYKTEYNKIRLGSEYDGGYIIADGLQYDMLVACGISTDVTFENHFINKYDIDCIAFDGTIDNLPSDSHNKIKFIKKNITKSNTETTTNLSEYIENKSNLFLKMDIETNEYQWLESMSTDNINKFSQIVMEIHFPFTYSHHLFASLSYPMPVEEKLNLIRKLNETHYLIHLHPNSCCGTTSFNNVKVPNVIECTYLRKDLVTNKDIDLSPIPDRLLDMPNRPNEGEIQF